MILGILILPYFHIQSLIIQLSSDNTFEIMAYSLFSTTLLDKLRMMPKSQREGKLANKHQPSALQT